MTTTKARTDGLKAIGQRPLRHDGVDKLTGKARFGADIHLPGMLHGKVLRSPHPHARIKAIDTSKAEAHPDVRAVATFQDLAQVSSGPTEGGETTDRSRRYEPDSILASEKVLYKGHPVAAIAADNTHVAEELLSLIDVEYEALPHVTDVEEAMKPGAPVLHEHMSTSGLGDDVPVRPTNISEHQQYSLGNIEEGFDHADLVLEREFRTGTVHQGYIEPHNATAWWGPDGQVTIWCSSQNPFGIRDTTATLLGVPVSTIRVVPMEIGGGFGGKLAPYLEPVAAVLSRKSGRPVKMTMTRSEVLEATGPTSASYIKARLGVTKEGRIAAAQAHLAFAAGAYPGSPLGGAATNMFSPYDIEHLLVDTYDVVINKPKTRAYRAPGAPIGAFAVEALVDEACEKLAIDPVEFRLANAASEGSRRADGTTNPLIGMNEVAQAVKNSAHYSAPLVGANRGRGVAFGFWVNGSGPSTAVAAVDIDGTVSLVVGSVDIGGTRTSVAQQLAEVLGNTYRRCQATGGRYRHDRLHLCHRG